MLLIILFAAEYIISSEIDKYPHFKHIVQQADTNPDIKALPLILQDRYYVYLHKNFQGQSNEEGELRFKNGNLSVEISCQYPSQLKGTYMGTFKYFDPGKPLVAGEKAVDEFLNGYDWLRLGNDAPVHMVLVERLDTDGSGRVQTPSSKITTKIFPIDKNQVAAIAVAIANERMEKRKIDIYKKIFCGIVCSGGLLAFIVFCVSKLLK